jgi:hypothetical protein
MSFISPPVGPWHGHYPRIEPRLSGKFGVYMPRIREEFLDCVIYLYPDRSAAEAGEKIGGTGFLVGVQSKGLPQNFWFLYAVTNKHVINGGATTIRFTTRDNKTDVLETDERSWVHHPSGDDLSVCLVSLTRNFSGFILSREPIF